jgi:hypothetical protein
MIANIDSCKDAFLLFVYAKQGISYIQIPMVLSSGGKVVDWPQNY